MLAFFPIFFTLKYYFWGIDCRTMIGWNLFQDIFCIFIFLKKEIGGTWHFLPNSSTLIFFFEVLIVEPWLIGMDFFGVQIITVSHSPLRANACIFNTCCITICNHQYMVKTIITLFFFSHSWWSYLLKWRKWIMKKHNYIYIHRRKKTYKPEP